MTEFPQALPTHGGSEASHSAVSWAAIVSGAFAALSVALLLVTLEAGFGLASVSPWANSGVSAATFAVSTGIGLIVVHWLSSAIGGYVTSRLRTKWTSVHTHEVFFRDTVHGFLAWAVAALVGAVVLSSAVTSTVSGGAHMAAGAAAAGSQKLASDASSDSAYSIDKLFRSDRADPAAGPQNVEAQAGRILAKGLANGDVPQADRSYLAQLVAGRTGIPQADAQKRVDDMVADEQAAKVKAKQAADAARKAASAMAFFSALAMLIGAFIASVAAAYGGGLRDEAHGQVAMATRL